MKRNTQEKGFQIFVLRRIFGHSDSCRSHLDGNNKKQRACEDQFVVLQIHVVPSDIKPNHLEKQFRSTNCATVLIYLLATQFMPQKNSRRNATHRTQENRKLLQSEITKQKSI